MKAVIETKQFARVETLNTIRQQATVQTEIAPKTIDVIVAAWREQFEKLQESSNVSEIKT